MVFVNCIASIVHHATIKYAGAVNKNIGDAFLLVWRLTDEDVDSVGCVDDGPFKPSAKCEVVQVRRVVERCVAQFTCRWMVPSDARSDSRILWECDAGVCACVRA